MFTTPSLSTALALAGAGLLAFVAYRLGLPRAYIAYWSQAAKADSDVSSKRAVFIHGAFFGAIIIATVLRKADWKFNQESLSAFETFLYMTLGGLVGGGIVDIVAAKMRGKVEPK